MTLNASGPISLGGSTVGQSINLELGQAATATASINATNFRTLAGVASGQISLSNFYGKSSVSYWISILYGPTIQGGSAALDGSDNVYITGNQNTGGSSLFIFKLNSSGALQVQNKYANLGNDSRAIEWDSTNSRLVVATTGGGLLSVNSSLAVGSITVSNVFTGINVGSFAGANLQQMFLFNGKATYVGSISRAIGCCTYAYFYVAQSDTGYTATNNSSRNSAALDNYGYSIGYYPGSANFYASGFNNDSTGTLSLAGVFKYNATTFANVSRYVYEPESGASFFGFAIAVDASDNVYIGTQSSNNNGYLGKIAGGTSVTWTRKLTGYVIYAYNNVVDSSGNVYTSYYISAGGSIGIAIGVTKFNSSGTLQWARIIYCSSGTASIYPPVGRGINLTSSGALLISGYFQAGNGIIAIQYPVDGSKTGSYVFGVGTVTIANWAVTVTNVTGNLYNPRYTDTPFSSTYTSTATTAVATTRTFYTSTI